MLTACGTSFFTEAQIPELAGVWGSMLYSRSEYQMEVVDPLTGEKTFMEFPAVEIAMTPVDTTYTMFKFEGDEVWLMKSSPFIDAPAGQPFPCTVRENDMVSSPLFPEIYKTSTYQVTELTDKYLKLVHINDGPSLATGDTVIYGYRAEITFRRLK